MALWTKEELEETRKKVYQILDEGVYPYFLGFEFQPEWNYDLKMICVMLKHKRQGIPLEKIIIDMHESAIDLYHKIHPQYKRPNWTYD